MNILLIISPYSPAQTPNTIRWNAVVDEFEKKGYSLSVLSSRWYPSDLTERSGTIEIYRTGHHSLLDMVYNLFHISRRRNVTSSPRRKHGIVRRILEALVDRFWRRYYWPDGSVLFLKPAIRKASSLHLKKKFDCVISVGLPFTNHMVAMKLKEKNPELRWVMDIEDAFCYSREFWVNNFDLYEDRNIRVEKKAFLLADKISLTNSVAMEKYLELFPEAKEKCVVIPPLIKPGIRRVHQASGGSSKLRLAYFGSFYEKVRSPLAFMQFLDKLNQEYKLRDLEIDLYGEQSPFSIEIIDRFTGLKDVLNLKAFVPREELDKLVMSYDILLNFSNTTNYHLPSKLVELIYYNKPLVNIVSRDDDISMKFLDDKLEILNLNLTTRDFEDSKDLFLNFIHKNRPESQPNLDRVQEYLPETIAASYERLLFN